MDIFQIAAIGIMSAILALTIKRQNPEIALMISIVAGVIIFILITPKAAAIFQSVTELSQLYDGGLPYISSVIKIIGVAYIAQFGTQICIDAGETSVASKIELAGKVAIMTISFPILKSLLDLVMNVLA